MKDFASVLEKVLHGERALVELGSFTMTTLGENENDRFFFVDSSLGNYLSDVRMDEFTCTKVPFPSAFDGNKARWIRNRALSIYHHFISSDEE